MTKEDMLKKAHTRQLMKWRDRSYACGGRYNPIGDGVGDFEVSTEQILAELNTREHVPSKKESQAIRQNEQSRRSAKAKLGYSRIGHNNV